MKRAKQRKRHYPYKWAGEWSYIDRDIYPELAKPTEVPPRGKLYKGEIGSFDAGVVIKPGKSTLMKELIATRGKTFDGGGVQITQIWLDDCPEDEDKK